MESEPFWKRSAFAKEYDTTAVDKQTNSFDLHI